APPSSQEVRGHPVHCVATLALGKHLPCLSQLGWPGTSWRAAANRHALLRPCTPGCPNPRPAPKHRDALHPQGHAELGRELTKPALVSPRTTRPLTETDLLLQRLPLGGVLAHEFGSGQGEPKD